MYLIVSVGTHFIIVNNPYSYCYKKVDNGIKITDFIYKVYNNYDCTKSELIIPSQFRGKDVKVIGAQAFGGHNFDTVVIPDTVEQIEEYAFLGTNIKSLQLSNNVRIVDDYAFNGCELNGLTLPNSLEEIGDKTFEFNIDNHVDFINVPKSVKKIGWGAFAGVKVICLEGESVENTGEYAFYYDSNKVYFNSIAYKQGDIVYALHSNKVATVAHVCYDCTELNILECVTYNNEIYKVTTIGEDSCVYTKLEKIIIPNTITTIKSYAFANSKNLTKVFIPVSVIEVEG